MKLLLTHGARDFEAQVDPSGSGYVVALDGVEHRIEGVVGASMRVRIDSRPLEAWVRRQGEDVIVEIKGRALRFRTRDPRAPKLARRKGHADLARG